MHAVLSIIVNISVWYYTYKNEYATEKSQRILKRSKNKNPAPMIQIEAPSPVQDFVILKTVFHLT